MARTTHRMRASCPFANSDDGIEVEIAFSFLPGAKATGPSYASGGDPGYGPEVELVSVRVVDPTVTLSAPLLVNLKDWAEQYLTDNDGYYEACETAEEARDGERERAAEMRDEQRRER